MAGTKSVPISTHAVVDSYINRSGWISVILTLDNGLNFNLNDPNERDELIEYCQRVYDRWEGLDVSI